MKTKHQSKMAQLKRVLAIAAAGGACLAFVGCSSAGANERRGTAAGAAIGAVVGGVVGHQSGEEGEGAAIGAAAGALAGREIGRSKDEADYERAAEVNDQIGADVFDYGEVMTESEKERVRERSGESFISDWGDYLTATEKERLRDRAEGSIGG